MRRQKDSTLQAWAHQILSRLADQGRHTVTLVYHGAPGADAPSSAHADDEANAHLLEMEDVTVADLEFLRRLLSDQAGRVVVRQASPVAGSATVTPTGEMS